MLQLRTVKNYEAESYFSHDKYDVSDIELGTGGC